MCKKTENTVCITFCTTQECLISGTDPGKWLIYPGGSVIVGGGGGGGG